MTNCEAQLSSLIVATVRWSPCRSPPSLTPPTTLPSWNEGQAKQSIVAFVERVTAEGSPDFVPAASALRSSTMTARCGPSSRCISSLRFALDRVKALAPQHPEWNTQEPFASLLKGDVKGGARGRRACHSRDRDGHPCGHDHRRIRSRSSATGSPRAKHPKTGQALHGNDLSADAGVAGLSARQRFQDVHRLGRRHRVHAGLQRDRSMASRPSRWSAAAAS